MLFNQLTEEQKESFKFQFARDVTGKLSRNEVIALFCFVAMQANDNKDSVMGMTKEWADTHLTLSKGIIQHCDEIGADWRCKIQELCHDFDCVMTTRDCIDLFITYIEKACPEDICL